MKFTNDKSYCATCEYWFGQRNIDRMTGSVETQTYSRGKCLSEESPFTDCDTFYSLACPNWKKWKAMN